VPVPSAHPQAGKGVSHPPGSASSSKAMLPNAIVSPADTDALPAIRSPLTRMPAVLLRPVSTTPSSETISRACRREMFGSRNTTSHSGLRPTRTAPAGSGSRRSPCRRKNRRRPWGAGARSVGRSLGEAMACTACSCSGCLPRPGGCSGPWEPFGAFAVAFPSSESKTRVRPVLARRLRARVPGAEGLEARSARLRPSWRGVGLTSGGEGHTSPNRNRPAGAG
jgi:hypothetical protein